MKRTLRVLILGVCLMAGNLGARGGEVAGAEVVSPTVREAIGGLSADSFKAREKAVQELRAAMGEQMRALVTAQEEQSRARATAALEYQSGLARWALETIKLSNEKRKAAVEFGLRADVVGVVAEAFSPNLSKRVEGIKLLAKFDEKEATALLARLIDDGNQKVATAAMEAAGERKATPELTDALWSVAVGTKAALGNPGMEEVETDEGAVVRPLNQQESDTACDMLIKLNTPLVGEHMGAEIKSLEDVYVKSPNPPFAMNQAIGLKSFLRLVESYKPKEAYGTVYRIATGATGPVFNLPGKNGFYMSSRTAFIAEFVKLMGEKPEDYKLKAGRLGRGSWSFPTEGDETEAIGKLRTWWEKHGREYGDAATQPAAE